MLAVSAFSTTRRARAPSASQGLTNGRTSLISCEKSSGSALMAPLDAPAQSASAVARFAPNFAKLERVVYNGGRGTAEAGFPRIDERYVAQSVESSGEIETVCKADPIRVGDSVELVFRAYDEATPPFTVRIKSPSGQTIVERVLRELRLPCSSPLRRRGTTRSRSGSSTESSAARRRCTSNKL